MFMPVIGDVDASGYPGLVMGIDVIKETRERRGAAGAAMARTDKPD